MVISIGIRSLVAVRRDYADSTSIIDGCGRNNSKKSLLCIVSKKTQETKKIKKTKKIKSLF